MSLEMDYKYVLFKKNLSEKCLYVTKFRLRLKICIMEKNLSYNSRRSSEPQYDINISLVNFLSHNLTYTW